MAKTWFAIQHNSEGRPCGWGIAGDRETAEKVAGEQYASHECYPGEEKGPLCVFTRAKEGIPWEPVDVCDECQENNDSLTHHPYGDDLDTETELVNWLASRKSSARADDIEEWVESCGFDLGEVHAALTVLVRNDRVATRHNPEQVWWLIAK